METKHTPGPWRVIPDLIRECYIITCLADGEATAPLRDEHQANARLMAAAPDLLDALRRIADDERDDYFRDIARAAIAKAEGRS